MDVVGLGVEDELSSFKVCSSGEDFGVSCLGSYLLFFCRSTL